MSIAPRALAHRMLGTRFTDPPCRGLSSARFLSRQVEGGFWVFFWLVVLPSHYINSSIRRSAMLAASKRNERYAQPFKLKLCCLGFGLVLPSHHTNSSIPRGVM